MRYVLLALVLMSFSVVIPQGPAAAQQRAGILIREVLIQGFVPDDTRPEIMKLFKPFRNKYLAASDMDGILGKLQAIYEREGYQQLVAINYQVINHRLVFTVSMIS